MKYLLLVLALLTATPTFAVQPDEVLPDAALETRARDISQGLRCLVCRNENIDESNAELAKDLRLLVRERLVAGDTNDEVVDYVVDRYGEFVLLKPTLTGANKLLWIAGPVMLILALIIGLTFIQRRGKEPEVADLTEDEEARLARLMND
ncbi:cytochrome c-type biogenesis protein [Celeribacter sp. PS-C1]|uniref:cytochrome c-type biogenesis protein n=1 Tax=Celeribacter sp. PS-C1 TaxID=2820813 RepID=UPI001C6684A9|nr:cytochrome c-type biogenesis protein [Celeribacter sp. PS-C1]MBW6419448.1 cytochrome c-type biogenesis protein CcmH [Celeribacter sp. PS-C1]